MLHVHTRSVLGVTLLALLGAAPSAAAGQTPPAEVTDSPPVVGTFGYSSGNTDAEAEIRGAVHGVRRVPGGTAVYYSLGVADGQTFNAVRTMPNISLSEAYNGGDAFAVRLVDPKGLQLYLPLNGPDGCLCSQLVDFGRESGRLTLGWAVLPELPADVSMVSVLIGYGSAQNVPVEQGELTPAVDTTPLPLGAGWPVLPTAQQVTAVGKQTPFVRTLVRRTADRQGTVTTSETSGKVDEALSADVLFAVGSATLTPAARTTLQQVAARVKERAAGAVSIIGHTDSTGGDAANQALSEARARAVRDALQGGVGGGVTLQASGRGEREPVADEATPQGRQANRRVTVTYTLKAGS